MTTVERLVPQLNSDVYSGRDKVVADEILKQHKATLEFNNEKRTWMLTIEGLFEIEITKSVSKIEILQGLGWVVRDGFMEEDRTSNVEPDGTAIIK